MFLSFIYYALITLLLNTYGYSCYNFLIKYINDLITLLYFGLLIEYTSVFDYVLNSTFIILHICIFGLTPIISYINPFKLSKLSSKLYISASSFSLLFMNSLVIDVCSI
jgi:hypothetical protein